MVDSMLDYNLLFMTDKLMNILIKEKGIPYISYLAKYFKKRYIFSGSFVNNKWKTIDTESPIVEELIEKINDITFDNNSLIKWAITFRYYKIVDILLKNGINPSLEDNNLLMIAIRNDDKKMVKILMKYNIDISLCNNVVLMFCIAHNNESILKLLIRNDIKTYELPLVVSAKERKINMMKIILKYSMELNHRIIKLCLKYGNKDAIKLLAKNKNNPTIKINEFNEYNRKHNNIKFYINDNENHIINIL